LQSWKSFLRNHGKEIASIDLLVVPAIAFQRLFVCLVLGHQRRQLSGFAVTGHPAAEWLARQLTEAFPWDTAPKYQSVTTTEPMAAPSRLGSAMGIRDQPASYRSPWQNGHAERLIGSVRRECTDHLIAFNADHLRRILVKYAAYYNEMRTHVSLGKDAPHSRLIERIGEVVANPMLGGLHHRYARI
jgi:transposase InsO family protein